MGFTIFAGMMKLSGITSRRGIKHRPSWNLVFEWEDILSRSLSVPLRCPGRVGWTLRSIVRRLGLPFSHSGDPTLEFVMVAKPDNQGRYGRNSVPWIIDYFLSDSDTCRFLESTAHCPLVFVSSYEAYERLLACGADPDRFRHVPLSLPDCYRLDGSWGVSRMCLTDMPDVTPRSTRGWLWRSADLAVKGICGLMTSKAILWLISRAMMIIWLSCAGQGYSCTLLREWTTASPPTVSRR